MFSYSTISFSNLIAFTGSFNCQNIGVCHDGSLIPSFAYNDPGYCSYVTGCPRMFEFSSTIYPQHHFVGTYSGGASMKHEAYFEGTYQRPALFY